MAQIIPGSVIGTYETNAITIGISKNDNRDGVKARFAILTVKDDYSAGARPKRLIFFENETISTEQITILAKYKAAQPDAKGGYPINIQALKASPDDWKAMEKWFTWPGGNVEEYKLRKGLCYGNDINGNPTTLKDGTQVITDTIGVFTQVKFFTPEADGSLKPHYVAGLGLEEQGRRMEDRFYKVAVNPVVQNNAQSVDDNNEDGSAASPADPF
jgi:hypothetical protein